MKQSLTDLNEYLFNALDRLTNDDLTGEALSEEIQRSKAVTSVAQAIVHNAEVVLDASRLAQEYCKTVHDVLPMALPEGAE